MVDSESTELDELKKLRKDVRRLLRIASEAEQERVRIKGELKMRSYDYEGAKRDADYFEAKAKGLRQERDNAQREAQQARRQLEVARQVLCIGQSESE